MYSITINIILVIVRNISYMKISLFFILDFFSPLLFPVFYLFLCLLVVIIFLLALQNECI